MHALCVFHFRHCIEMARSTPSPIARGSVSPSPSSPLLAMILLGSTIAQSFQSVVPRGLTTLLNSSARPQKEPGGRLDYHEVKSAIRAMGFAVHKGQLLQLLGQYCEDAEGLGITKDEFASVAMRFISQRTALQEITRDFLVFDTRRRCVRCGLHRPGLVMMIGD